MKFLILIFILSFTLSSFAQKGFKYDKKMNIVYNEDKPVFKITNDEQFKSQVLVKNLEDSLLVFFISKEMREVIPSTRKNPKGAVYCKACLLLTPNQQSVEVPEGKSLKYYAKIVYNNNLISENKLDTIAVNTFVNKVGNPYSSKYIVCDKESKTYSTPYRQKTN